MKIDYRRMRTGLIAMGIALASGAASAVAPITGSIDPVSGVLTASATIKHTLTKIGNQYANTAAGTSMVSTNITVAGVSRRYVLNRPSVVVPGAPVLLLLHPNSTSPENMANLSYVTDFVLTQGFWAVMPAAINGVWKDDPGSSNSDDVAFISALIDSLVAQGADATRIYAAGFSNGGFMSERLACELSDKIAGFGIDAATLHGTQASACAPIKQRSKVYFLGTADNIVPYAGISSGTPNGLWGATDTLNFWVSKQQHCGGVIANSIPDRVNDGTTVQQNVYTGCTASTQLQLYTVYNGGHAWPGGATSSVGTTTQDVIATGLIWRFVSPLRR